MKWPHIKVRETDVSFLKQWVSVFSYVIWNWTLQTNMLSWLGCIYSCSLMCAGVELRRIRGRLFCSCFFRGFTWSCLVLHLGVLPRNGPWPVPFPTFASHLIYLGLLPIRTSFDAADTALVNKPGPQSGPSTHICPQSPIPTKLMFLC